jgi:hypothetical protein
LRLENDRVQKIIKDHIQHNRRRINDQVAKIQTSNEYLSAEDKTRVIRQLDMFLVDLNYLKAHQALLGTYTSPALTTEIAKHRKLLHNYNKALEIRQRQTELQCAQQEFQSLLNQDRYFTQQSYAAWIIKWNHLNTYARAYPSRSL